MREEEKRARLLEFFLFSLFSQFVFLLFRPLLFPLKKKNDKKKRVGLRGLVATAPITRGETVVRLPVEAAIMVRPKMKCPLPEEWCTRDYWSKAPWFTRAALMLLFALGSSDGNSSSSSAAAKAYAAALPPKGALDTPAVGRWTEEELEQLHYAPLVDDVRQQRASWSEAFTAYCRACPRSPLAVAGDGEASWDWALSCVRSRAFSGPYAGPPLKQRLGLAGVLVAAGVASVFCLHAPPEQVLNGAIAAALFNLMYDVLLSSKVKWHALCPLVDMANHSSRAQSEMTYAYFGDALELSVGGLVSGGGGGDDEGNNNSDNVAFREGQQVFISYGPQTNDSLLQYYGFVEEANQYDAYRLVWDVSEGEGEGEGEGEAEGGKEKGKARKLATTVMTRSGPDEASVQAVMEALDELRGRGGSGKTATRKDALRAIHGAATREAARWPTTAAEDAKMIGEGGRGRGGGEKDSGRLETALAFRIQKKRVLAAAAKACLKMM